MIGYQPTIKTLQLPVNLGIIPLFGKRDLRDSFTPSGLSKQGRGSIVPINHAAKG
jgi:hypothetical protein